MPRRKSDLNTIYISERLQEYLRPAAAGDTDAAKTLTLS